MLASPVLDGEREPQWHGQWDAVSGEHILIHRPSHAVRRGPWVSMPAACRRGVYFLSLLTGETRWDPPPCWEAQWVRRAAQLAPLESDDGTQVVVRPAAVPRGREVSGGAAVGFDEAAALLPCIEQLLPAALGDCAETDVADVMARPEISAQTGAFQARLETLISCAEVVVAAAAERFAFTVGVGASAVSVLCPELLTIGTAERARLFERACSERRRGSLVDPTLERLKRLERAYRRLRRCLRDPFMLTQALMPRVIAAGGFRA